MPPNLMIMKCNFMRQKAQSHEGFLVKILMRTLKIELQKEWIVKVNDKAISNVIEDDYLLEEMSDLDIENEMNESSMSTRSGLTLISTNVVACQADFVHSEQPIIRYRRKCTEQIKTICAKVSSTAQISAKKARTLVQVVSRELYGHIFYLSVEDSRSSSHHSSEGLKGSSVTPLHQENKEKMVNQAKCQYLQKTLKITNLFFHLSAPSTAKNHA